MPEITDTHLEGLSEFDRLLAHGPYWEKLAAQGAAAGAVVSLLAGPPESRGKLGHAAAYAVAGTGLAIGGTFILFQLGKFVSSRSHGAVAEAAARGEFMAGYRGGFGRRGGFGHHMGPQRGSGFARHMGPGHPMDQDDGDDSDRRRHGIPGRWR